MRWPPRSIRSTPVSCRAPRRPMASCRTASFAQLLHRYSWQVFLAGILGRYSWQVFMSRRQNFAISLRGWRRQRGLSQLELAAATEISQRHLSFLELGRASPSRDMVMRLAAALDVPLRQHNALLVAA